MGIYVKTVKICVVGLLFTTLSIVCIKYNLPYIDLIWVNLCIGVFTGFLVSFIIMLSNYFYEKSVVLTKIKLDLITLYTNLAVIHDATKDIILPKIKSGNILQLSGIDTLSKENMEIFGYETFDRFYPFCQKSKLSKVIEAVILFQDKLRNLRNIHSEARSCLLKNIMEKDATVRENNKNGMIVQLTTSQEYCKTLLLELDGIVSELLKLSPENMNLDDWEDHKKSLKRECDTFKKD